AAACGIALVLVLGFKSDDGLGQRYPVHGRVTYGSQPLKIGRITFYPIDTASTARDATGTIQDGDYSLSTIGAEAGRFPCSYRVTIVARSAEPSKVQPIVPGGAASPFDAIKAVGRAKDLISPRYKSPRLSPLTREVKAGTNRFDFELED